MIANSSNSSDGDRFLAGDSERIVLQRLTRSVAGSGRLAAASVPTGFKRCEDESWIAWLREPQESGRWVSPVRKPLNVIRNDATRVSGLVSRPGDGRGRAYGTSRLSRNARKSLGRMTRTPSHPDTSRRCLSPETMVAAFSRAQSMNLSSSGSSVIGPAATASGRGAHVRESWQGPSGIPGLGGWRRVDHMSERIRRRSRERRGVRTGPLPTHQAQLAAGHQRRCRRSGRSCPE